MDLWTDFNWNAEWGLDLLDQPNGLFGDLKDTGRLVGDMDPAQKPRDAVEQLIYSPESEGQLEMDWMESGDLGSLLEALDKGQDTLPTLESDLLDCSREIAIEDNISLTKSLASGMASFVGVDEMQCYIQTPPDSPEQVTPVIKIDPELSNSGELATGVAQQNFIISDVLPASELSPGQSPDYLLETDDTKFEVLETTEVFDFFPVNDVLCNSEQTETPPQIEISSCTDTSFSSDSTDSVLLSPEASPKPSIESFIQASPELYKVIANTSDLSLRFSPYKVKGEAKSKSDLTKGSRSGKGKTSPELISEEVISNHLSKKERKKLQNKNAAIRYRQKKKVEVQCIVGEVQDLEDKNHDLKTKVEDLQREIKYMKNLMEEIYKAKGIR